MITTTAVVGNGAAGALVVISLLREATRRRVPLELAWIGDGEPARGVAYATPHPWHRLNVPAPAMTLDEAETSFPRWLAAHGLGDHEPGDHVFAPRHAFGDYLAQTLRAARAAAAPDVRLTEHRDRAVGCAREQDSLSLTLRDGSAVRARQTVLALGPFPSTPLPSLSGVGTDTDPAAHARVVTDPWDGRIEQVGDEDTVLLLGSGLTAVDVALTVARRSPGARIIASSRTGLLPRDHVTDQGPDAEPAVSPRPGLSLDDVVTGVEDAVASRDGRWREVVDGLRPVTPGLWRSMPRPEQRRFLTEQARRWETHRHRMAPAVAAELHDLRASGRLRLHRGGVERVDLDHDRPRVTLHGDAGSTTVDWLVSCTGAQDDVTAVDDPLVRSLLDAGLARPHPLGLGFDTAENGTLGAGPDLYAIGVLRRGELYETTAVPEIHEQAGALARHLLRPR